MTKTLTLPSIEDKLYNIDRVVDYSDLDALVNHHIPNQHGAYFCFQQNYGFVGNDTLCRWYDVAKGELSDEDNEQLRKMREDWANPVKFGFPAEYDVNDYSSPLRANPQTDMPAYMRQSELAQEALGRDCPCDFEVILTYLANIGALSEGPLNIWVSW